MDGFDPVDGGLVPGGRVDGRGKASVLRAPFSDR